jgi:hypothetical protein
MLAFNPKAVFDRIPEASKHEWLRREATAEQICPALKHETSANRAEVLRLLNNWATQLVNGARQGATKCE